jgi:hypothetical protein
MFGMAQRSYRRKVSRLRESVTVSETHLSWLALVQPLDLTRAELGQRFPESPELLDSALRARRGFRPGPLLILARRLQLRPFFALLGAASRAEPQLHRATVCSFC